MAKNLESTITPTLALYCDLMVEIKIRMAAILAAMAKPFEPIPAQILYELCYLQLRMICELLALACLVAHGDIEATKKGKMKKAYAADFIMNALEKLHPSFYPKPSQPAVDANGLRTVSEITAGYLTKADFLKLYVECGNILHRGNVMNMGTKINPKSVSFGGINVWCHKLVTLLNHHQIALSDPDYEIWVIMQSESDGRPYGHLFKKVPTSPKMNSNS